MFLNVFLKNLTSEKILRRHTQKKADRFELSSVEGSKQNFRPKNIFSRRLQPHKKKQTVLKNVLNSDFVASKI